jgi:hypothetical protein
MKFLVAVGVFEDGEIAPVGSAGGALRLLSCLRVCAMRRSRREERKKQGESGE